MRNSALFGLYSRTMLRAVWWSYWGGGFLTSEGPLLGRNEQCVHTQRRGVRQNKVHPLLVVIAAPPPSDVRLNQADSPPPPSDYGSGLTFRDPDSGYPVPDFG